MPRKPYMTTPPPITGMPRSIFYIVVNECAERFSFYGMNAILVVFLTQYLRNSAGELAPLDPLTADRWYHNFTAAVYATPIVGALLADIFWGKYNTILWISLFYCLGHAALAMGDTQTHVIVGLTLIAIGAGGIKPCVSANVGDQFGKTNEHLLSKVYGWFYFSINLGAFFSQITTPRLLKYFGPSVAFAVPGVLMAIATLVFWLGRNYYVHVPPQGWRQVAGYFAGNNWKIFLRLLFLFVMVSPFYALWYQSAAQWVIQAEHLDRKLFGFQIEQAEVQSVNALLILVFIPLFSYVIYPFVERFVRLTPLRKIGAGIFTMGLPFIIVGWLEIRIVAGEHPSVIWQLIAYALLTAAEIMVNIPILEFAYTQAPKKMKSLIMASYLAGSISLGNVIAGRVIRIFEMESVKPWVTGQYSPNYYWVFLGLIIVAGLIFAGVAMFYPVHDFVQDENNQRSPQQA